MCGRWAGDGAQEADCAGFGVLSWRYRTTGGFIHQGNLFVVHLQSGPDWSLGDD